MNREGKGGEEPKADFLLSREASRAQFQDPEILS